MRIVVLMLLFSSHVITQPLSEPESDPYIFSGITSNPLQTFLNKIVKGAVYLEIGSVSGSLADLARLGSGVCEWSPYTYSLGSELFLLSQLSTSITKRAFAQIVKEFMSSSSPIPISQYSWRANQKLLSQVPAFSSDDLALLHFLQEHWLAKAAGFSSMAIDWVYPCFNFHIQIHPSTNHAYARRLTTQLSNAYKRRMDAWKQLLPHPKSFPLILTRPANVQSYLPTCFEISEQNKIDATIEQLAKTMEGSKRKIVVDITHLLEAPIPWDTCRNLLDQACKKHNLDLSRILCIQRVFQETIGGIRLLPLIGQSKENEEFLLNWVSIFGLTANRIELDRWPIANDSSLPTPAAAFLSEPINPSKERLISTINALETKWKIGPPHKALMLCGTLQVIKGLLTAVEENKWLEVAHCPTRAPIVQSSIKNIRQQLNLLAKNESQASFFEITSHLEQIHAHLSSLLEIFMPFHPEQFSPIYQTLLPIPIDLKPLASYGIHSAAMASLAGIFKAVERTVGRKPEVIYGKNTYFECIDAAQNVSSALSIDEASERDLEQVDLLLAQFNPVLQLEIHPDYEVEKIGEILHKCLHIRKRGLTVALDCTIDFIHSPRLAALLQEFQKEIQVGILNIVGYRSGNKFDQFGMDNYCGAPFFMVHNGDPKWAFFDALKTDAALQADRLTLNWFCLAYQFAAPQLELYRAQIFKNTRDLLKKVPSRLLSKRTANYQVFPVQEDADPAFIDIKIAGCGHTVKSAVLLAGTLYMKSLEAGHAIFNRPSLGFYHPNFIMFFSSKNSTLRLSLGLDPAQVDLFAKCLETIDLLNGP